MRKLDKTHSSRRTGELIDIVQRQIRLVINPTISLGNHTISVNLLL